LGKSTLESQLSVTEELGKKEQREKRSKEIATLKRKLEKEQQPNKRHELFMRINELRDTLVDG